MFVAVKCLYILHLPQLDFIAFLDNHTVIPVRLKQYISVRTENINPAKQNKNLSIIDEAYWDNRHEVLTFHRGLMGSVSNDSEPNRKTDVIGKDYPGTGVEPSLPVGMMPALLVCYQGRDSI